MSGDCDVCGQYGHVEIEHCLFKDDLHNAQIRIEERDAKLVRQAEVITRLQKSRAGLKKNRQEISDVARAYVGWILQRLFAIRDTNTGIETLIDDIRYGRGNEPWWQHSKSHDLRKKSDNTPAGRE